MRRSGCRLESDTRSRAVHTRCEATIGTRRRRASAPPSSLDGDEDDASRRRPSARAARRRAPPFRRRDLRAPACRRRAPTPRTSCPAGASSSASSTSTASPPSPTTSRAVARLEVDRARVRVREEHRSRPLPLERRPRVVELARGGGAPEPDGDRGGRRERGHRAEDGHRPRATPFLQRDDVRLLGPGSVEDPPAQLEARGRPRRSDRERSRHEAVRVQLLARLLRAREELLRAGAVGRVERVERVAGDQLVSLGVHDPSVSASSSTSRRRASPANILLLMVPNGRPSRSASSDCE